MFSALYGLNSMGGDDSISFESENWWLLIKCFAWDFLDILSVFIPNLKLEGNQSRRCGRFFVVRKFLRDMMIIIGQFLYIKRIYELLIWRVKEEMKRKQNKKKFRTSLEKRKIDGNPNPSIQRRQRFLR